MASFLCQFIDTLHGIKYKDNVIGMTHIHHEGHKAPQVMLALSHPAGGEWLCSVSATFPCVGSEALRLAGAAAWWAVLSRLQHGDASAWSDQETAEPWGQGQVMGVLQSVSASATSSNEEQLYRRAKWTARGTLPSLDVVPECQNRPSGETSHSNWWLCIRQMHFYRVIHLSLSFLALLLAAIFPSCHYSLMSHHLSPASLFPSYASIFSFHTSPLL